MAGEEDEELFQNWKKLSDDEQYLIMKQLDDEKKLQFILDDNFAWVRPMVKTFTLIDGRKEKHGYAKDMAKFRRCPNATTLIIKLQKSQFFDREELLLPLMETIADINPNLESIQVTHFKSSGPSGVLLEVPVHGSQYILTAYIMAVLKKNPDYDGSKIKDSLGFHESRSILNINPNFQYKLVIDVDRNIELSLYENVKEIECTGGFYSTAVSISRIKKMENIDTFCITRHADFGPAPLNLLDAVCSKLKRIKIYTPGIYNPDDIVLPETPTRKVTDFVYAIVTTEGCPNQYLRILQVKNNVLIITNRFDELPIRDVVESFLNVDTIIFEVYKDMYYWIHRSHFEGRDVYVDYDDDEHYVYSEDDEDDSEDYKDDSDPKRDEITYRDQLPSIRRYVTIKHKGLTEAEVREQIEVIRNEDNREIKLIVVHEQ